MESELAKMGTCSSVTSKGDRMEKKTFLVPNISCEHCVRTIKNELNEIVGVTSVDGNPNDKTVTVEWNPPASVDMIRKTLKEIDYPATDAG
jgi:copper chaperone CopZ